MTDSPVRRAARPAMPLLTDIPYLPQDPEDRSVPIGLIGCGGISRHHLEAYRDAGYTVTMLCDVNRVAAEARREEYFPEARVTTDYRQLLADARIQVVDIATHPEVRVPIIAEALEARKHVLSQKPFVVDLDEGERLADLADRQGVLLAVNQNGRWAPHFSWLREAVAAGHAGQVSAVHCGVHWDHTWVVGTPFEQIYHLILYDFAIHWFDFLTTLSGLPMPTDVYATTTVSPNQPIKPALLAQVAIHYPGAQATLVFDAHTPFGRHDETMIIGDRGTLRSFGPDSKSQVVQITNADGVFRPRLEGAWFSDGFHGAMGELLVAIEQGRQPTHNARDNLRSLELCFAALSSGLTGRPVRPGEVRQLPVHPNQG